MTVAFVRYLIGHAGFFALVLAGLLLLTNGSSADGRRLAARFFLLGVLLAIVTSFINQGWLP